MANFNVYIRQYQDSEFIKTFSVDPTSLTVARGDTITFIRSDVSGTISNSTVNIAGLTSNKFNDTIVSLTTNGASDDSTVLMTAPLGVVNLTASASGFTSRGFTVDITSGVDETPDNFSFDNITLAQPNSVIESNTVSITGINTPVAVSTSGGHFMIGNDQVWRTSGTVSNGQNIRLRDTASSSYNATVSMSCTVGTLTRSWSITTANDPGSGEVINFPITALPIKLTDVIKFYGGNTVLNNYPPGNLRAYFNNAGYVPNIAKNAGIPTSGVLKLSDFLGSGTALYFLRYPSFRGASGNTLNSPANVSVAWTYTDSSDVKNPLIGFGNITYSCEYRYKVIENTGPDYNTGVTSSVSNSIGVFSAWAQIGSIGLSVTIPQGQERMYSGTVYFEVRSLYDTTKVLTGTAGYNLAGFGN